MDKLLQKRCVSRQCLRVQLVGGKVFVVAPASEQCSYDDMVVGQCSSHVRKSTDGVAANYGAGAAGLGKWDQIYSPTSLHWHFAAGVNVSSCAGSIRPGDFNGAFTRLRLVTSLRLLEEAARSGAVRDTELILCLQETPLNAGGWCLRGAQPIFAMTTNEEAPMLAFPHWTPRFRDVDFALWDDARRAERRAATVTDAVSVRVRKAVFRGGVYRLSAYSDRWRTRGCRKTLLTDKNNRRIGRTALLHALTSETVRSLVNVNVFVDAYAKRLGLNASLLEQVATPAFLSLAEQSARFRYALNIEGHGGWADRLYKLLLSPMLVIAQDVAPRLWFETALRAGETHLTVDSNFRNLTAVISWARRHDAQVTKLAQNAHEAMDDVLSVDAIRWYVRELVNEYTSHLLRRTTVRHPRAIRFECEDSSENLGNCHVPGRGLTARKQLLGTRCAFVGADSAGGQKRRFATLHKAAQALLPPISGLKTERQRVPSSPLRLRNAKALALARKAVCSAGDRTNARADGKWCYNFDTPGACQSHYVPAAAPGCPRRSCVWRPTLHKLNIDADALCPRSSLGSGMKRASGRSLTASPAGGGACIAVCACGALCGASLGTNGTSGSPRRP